MAATASVTGLVTWTRSPMRWLGLGRRLSLPGPRPEAEPALVNRRLSDHGNGLGQGARGGGGGGSSLVSSRGGRAAAAAAAALARGPCQHGKPRSKGRSCKRSSGRLPDECGALRPVTVDSSKAKTSLDALKISIRQLKWKEVQMVKEGDPSWKPTFIVKPDGGCQGDGIYLIKDPTDARLAGTLQSRPAVVQEYMCKPLLIDKLKFDIRLYVLLKSLDPLEIYIAKDGLSRFCTEPYQEPSAQNLHHVFMHLTNYSLNIHSGNFIHSDSASTGSKRTFSSILCRLSSKGVDIKKVWSDIISLVIKTVIALTPELKVFYQSDIPTGRPGPTCFQVPASSISQEGRACGQRADGRPRQQQQPRSPPAFHLPQAGVPQVREAVQLPAPGGQDGELVHPLPRDQGHDEAGTHRLPDLHQVSESSPLLRAQPTAGRSPETRTPSGRGRSGRGDSCLVGGRANVMDVTALTTSCLWFINSSVGLEGEP
uniref:Tubulin tyrosine ligase like 11 n=1 Tax=Oryctolagus cuniculus TaxID=9986 RepID=A0A5F9DG86_RABIT